MPKNKMNEVKPELWSAVMTAGRKVFLPGNRYGVFAFGIEQKAAPGISLGYYTLVIYVDPQKKVTDEQIPPIVIVKPEGEFLVIPEIIESSSRPKAVKKEVIPYNGLHAGSVIKVVSGRYYTYGGAACILSANGYEPTHLLTAGHLFPEDAEGTPVYAGNDNDGEVKCGELNINLLDYDYTRFDSHIDAALVELTADGMQLAGESASYGPGLEHIYKLNPGEELEVESLLPTSGNYSQRTRVHCLPNTVYFESELRRNDAIINNALATADLITVEGDSGTILMSYPNPKDAVGLCIGEYSTRSVFEPISRVLDILKDEYSEFELYK